MIFLIEGSAFFVAYDWFIIFVFILFSTIFLLKRKEVDTGFLWTLAFWVILNFVSAIVNGHLSLSLFLGSIIKICIPYLAVKILGYQFFEKFFKFCFFLVITSSVCYIFEVLFPSVVKSVTPYLNFLEHWRMLANGDFYIFFYNHLGEYNEYYGVFPRNCGFMWEPGAYAMMLNILIPYKLHRDNYQIDAPLILMFLALVSTFSTAGYFGIVIVLLFLIFRKKTRFSFFVVPVLLAALVIFSYRLYNSADFMSEKIDQYMEVGDDVREASFENDSWLRVTRVGMAMIALDNSTVHPWGDGVNMSTYVLRKYGNVTSANSLAGVFMKWGWIGFIFLVLAIYKLCPGPSKGLGPMLLLPFLISMFSNPYSATQYLIFFIFFYSIVCKNYRRDWNSSCSKSNALK